jgi:hypothetical protein
MKKLIVVLLPLIAFLFLACGGENTEQSTDTTNMQFENEEESIVGSWSGTWIQNEVHYNTKLPEANCEGINVWDPEFHESEGGVDWGLSFYIDENNVLNIVDGGEDRIVFKGDYAFSFETEWNCNRVIKWNGIFSEDFRNIQGNWEMHHPAYNLMSSGTWRASKF